MSTEPPIDADARDRLADHLQQHLGGRRLHRLLRLYRLKRLHRL